MHVLLVDDSDVFRQTLAATLIEQLRATVSEADGGIPALRVLEQRQSDGQAVDVVLVDLRMPDMDGMEVSRRILSHQLRPRVIMITAFDERTYQHQAQGLGVDGFFCKTDGVAALIAEIERVTA